MRFPLPTHPTNTASAAAARFITPHGIMAWAASDVNGRLPVPVDCQLRKLEVALTGAPGGAAAWIFEFWINGAVVEGAKLEIKGTATTGKWTGLLELKAGDKLSIRLTPVGEPNTAGTADGSAIFTTFETTGDVFFFGAGGNGQVDNLEAQNNCIYGVNSAAWKTSSEELQVRAPVPGKFKLKALAVDLSGVPGAAKSFTLAGRINGVTDALPVKIEGNAASTGLATGSVQLNPGDTLLLRSTPAGEPTKRSVRVGVAVEAENAGETFALGCNPNAESNTAFRTTFIDTIRTAAWGTGEAEIWETRPAALTVKNLYVEIGVAPGSGKTRTYEIYMDEKAMGVKVPLKDAEKAGSDLAHSFATDGKRLIFKSFPAGTPETNTGGAHWGFVVMVPQPAEIEASLGGTGGVSADLHGVAPIAADAGATGGISAALDTPASLSAALGATGGLEVGLDTPANLSAAAGGTAGLSVDLSVAASISAALGFTGGLEAGLRAVANLSADLGGTGGVTADLESVVTLVPGHGVAGHGAANQASAGISPGGSAAAGVEESGGATAKATGSGSAIIGS